MDALLAEVEGDVSHEADLAARLADVERQLSEALEAEGRCKQAWHNAARERDAARAELAKRPSEADWTALKSERIRLAEQLAAERKLAQTSCGRKSDARAQLRDERDTAQAKLDSALLQHAKQLADVQAELADANRRITDLRKSDDLRAQLLRERAAEIESLRAQLEQAESYVRDQHDTTPGGRLYDTHVRHLCVVCGARYRELHNHPCGRLVPVRVTIAFLEEYHTA